MQKVNVSNKFSTWEDYSGVPQVSILGSLLFDILINTASMCNYADDNTLYACSRDFTKLNNI